MASKSDKAVRSHRMLNPDTFLELIQSNYSPLTEEQGAVRASMCTIRRRAHPRARDAQRKTQACEN